MILKHSLQNRLCQSTKKQLLRSIGSTSTSETAPNLSMYKTYLEDLKYKPETRHVKVSDKSFLDVDTKKWNHISADEKAEVPWTSQYDPAARSPFAKDVSHLQSLLDALLSGKNWDRAYNILQAIYPLLPHPEDFIFSVNKYLENWGLQENVSYRDLTSFLSNFESDVIRDQPFRTTPRTEAILLCKLIQSNQDLSDFMISHQNNSTGIKRILENVDIIGVDGLMYFFRNAPDLKPYHIPNDLFELYNQAKSEITEDKPEEAKEIPDYFSNSSKIVPSLETNLDDLKAVDAFGLKVIRHTLLGLKDQTGDEEFDAMVRDMEQELDDNILYQDNQKKRDFFQIYKLLKTPEQQEKFSKALDVFNENRQKQLELRGIDGAREKWKHEFEQVQKRGSMTTNKGLNAIMFQWYTELLPYVEKEAQLSKDLVDGTNQVNQESLNATEKKQSKEREFYAPYFNLVEPSKMTVLTILELLKLNSSGGVVDGMRLARALVAVGRAVESEYRSKLLLRKDQKNWSKKLGSNNVLSRLKIQNKRLRGKDVLVDDWSPSLHVKIGAVLISLLMHIAKVPVTAIDPTTNQEVSGLQPAFHHTYQYLNGQKLGVLKIHKDVIRKMAGTDVNNTVQPQLLPMLTPPRPWVSHKDGGFMYSQNSLIRIKDSAETMAYLRAASDLENLNEVYEGLNILGDTAWTVNKKIFQVISHFWNTGKAIHGIPPALTEDLVLPDRLPDDAEPLEKLARLRIIRQMVNDHAANRSERCSTNYKLEIARAFVGEKLFFPHNVDFRGRAYPLSPHFNHLGSDVTRSLFLFWEGKEVGERGLEWLKIHLANVYGIDKVPLADRAKFAEDNLEQILESAKDPYKKDAWWTKGEKPWQVLSVCVELSEAYSLEDPTKHVSHLPIHQDGSCNGLQHYAALGGDIEGARQVNLLPADRPQDVYTHVANLVRDRINEDAAEGNELALFMQDKITRKVVKQTVMTNVYGVTWVGGVQQVKKQIEHLFPESKDSQESAVYVTSKVFASIRALFAGAHEIQDWLGESAKRIGKSVRIDYEETQSQDPNKPSHLSSVIWTTPLGLPCVQPYRMSKTTMIKTNLQDVTIGDPFSSTIVDSRKQQAAFPPNFVHSLDATHMLMTAKACGKHNLSFASVHDSFWTHACDVDIMNEEIRTQFVSLHKSDLVQQLKSEFERRYKGFLEITTIDAENEVARKVSALRKQISKTLGRKVTVADEIYLEKKRRQLLESSDPEVIKVGREMVTTVSITENYDIEEITRKKSAAKTVQVLVPLKFPEVPKRGDLDVEIVKDSKYFFS